MLNPADPTQDAFDRDKLTLCIDFDGVIHSYQQSWKGPTTIPDPPVEHALLWLAHLVDVGKFNVCIYSSRSKYEGGIGAMKTWMREHGMPEWAIDSLYFPTQKPAAFLTIDDRAICFTGKFPAVADILNFKPWNR